MTRKNIFVLNVFNTAKNIEKNDGRKNIFFVLNVFNTAKKRKKVREVCVNNFTNFFLIEWLPLNVRIGN